MSLINQPIMFKVKMTRLLSYVMVMKQVMGRRHIGPTFYRPHNLLSGNMENNWQCN